MDKKRGEDGDGEVDGIYLLLDAVLGGTCLLNLVFSGVGEEGTSGRQHHV